MQMVRLAAVILLPLAVLGAERWTAFRSGPFEVLSADGEKHGREALNVLEQFRNALGQSLGKQDLVTLWPVRVVAFENARKAAGYDLGTLTLRRDNYIGAMADEAPVPVSFFKDLARILIEGNAGRMPDGIERGLVDLFSTLDIQGTRVTLGQPVPPSERTGDWARIHMLAVDPNYSGKLRVLLGNLQQGAEPEPAYQNAFAKTPAEVEKEAAAYLARGVFETISVSGRAIAVQRDFPARPVEGAAGALALADLKPSEAAYQAVLKQYPAAPEPHEGLGHFEAAAKAGSRNARVYLELRDFNKAAELNPRWAEPHRRAARKESDPARKIAMLKKATSLDPRNAGLWEELAVAQTGAEQFADAARSWGAAERASPDEAERARLRQARRDLQEQRAEQEAAERRRAAEERERELQRLRDEAIARIRAAEAKANEGSPPPDPGRKVEQWWDGPRAESKVSGVLEKVDCLGTRSRLVVLSNGKRIQLLVADPSKITIMGGGTRSFTCGIQRPPRPVTIEYFAATGEAQIVEFR
jgi:hypothetical protein